MAAIRPIVSKTVCNVVSCAICARACFRCGFQKTATIMSSKVVGAYAPVYELIEFVYVQLEELDMVKGPVLSVEANDDLLTALDIMNSNGRLQRMRFACQ